MITMILLSYTKFENENGEVMVVVDPLPINDENMIGVKKNQDLILMNKIELKKKYVLPNFFDKEIKELIFVQYGTYGVENEMIICILNTQEKNVQV